MQQEDCVYEMIRDHEGKVVFLPMTDQVCQTMQWEAAHVVSLCHVTVDMLLVHYTSEVSTRSDGRIVRLSWPDVPVLLSLS